MPKQQGIIALMGSGELAASMVAVHKDLLNRLGRCPQAIFLDTPAGFQLNVDQISQKATTYFNDHVGYPLTIVSLKSVSNSTPYQIENAHEAVGRADYLFMGPGSPTYALDQWRQTDLPHLMQQLIAKGGCLTAASAATLTMGRFTLPVYEIYKAGHHLHWIPGLNLLGYFGFNLIVVPHWNNAEGGNHDTRFCYMGAPRLHRLEAMLPTPVDILGIDEHTVLIIDLSQNIAIVRGAGKVTLRRQGKETVFTKKDSIPLSLLRQSDTNTVASASPDAVPLETHHMETQVRDLEDQFRTALNALDAQRTAETLLNVERLARQQQENSQNNNLAALAGKSLRRMIIALADQWAMSPGGRTQCLSPLVETLLSLRTDLRRNKKWNQADALRQCLLKAGIVVEDTDQGARWYLEEKK